jgi:hypothetical protein
VSIWNGKRPTDRIRAVLQGKVPLESEDQGIQSACSKHIYDGARSVLKLSTKEARRAALDRVPALIRPHLEREILRLHKARK